MTLITYARELWALLRDSFKYKNRMAPLDAICYILPLLFLFSPQKGAADKPSKSAIQLDSSTHSPDDFNAEFGSLSLAPPIPLEPEYPLGMTESNRRLLVDSPAQLKKNQESIRKFLNEHSFPWLSLAALLSCGAIGWVLFLSRGLWLKYFARAIPALSSKKKMDSLLQELDKQAHDNDPTQQHYAAFSSIISNVLQTKSGVKTENLTTVQISQIIKNQSFLSSQEIEEDLSLLSEIDQVKFGGKVPSQAETGEISKKIQIFVRQILN